MAAAALAALLATACSCGAKPIPVDAPGGPTAAGAAEGRVPTPPGAGQPATGREALGINEGVSVPLARLRGGDVGEDAVAASLAADARAIAGLGAGIVRANTATTPWLSWWSWQKEQAAGRPWARADQWVTAVQAEGLEPLLMLGPWPGNRTGSFTDRYVPTDMDGYLAWVTAVVERYDGDGLDDMPGLLRPVRYFEVDNEPDLHNSVPPRGAKAPTDPAEFETPAQYAQVLVATSAAIRAAHPDPVVLSAGLYRPHTRPGRAWLEALLAEPGARDAFDVLSLHCYSDEDGLDAVHRTLATWRELAPDKGLWVTETGVPSEGRRSHIDADWQARMVVATVGAFLAGGAERVLWHTLADPPAGNRDAADSPFAHHSLFQAVRDTDQLIEKPSGAMYRAMAEVLGPTDPARYAAYAAGTGQALETDRGWLVYAGSLPRPDGAGPAHDLRTGAALDGATVPAPAWIARATP